jgi:hypothetical protein
MSPEPIKPRNVLEYGRFKPHRLVRVFKIVGIRIAIVIALIIAAFVPHPRVEWYLGHRPQWMVYIDYNTAYVGRTDDPIRIDAWPFLVLKLMLFALPAWVAWRLTTRRRRRR